MWGCPVTDRQFNIVATNMSSPQYDPDEEEMPEKVGIITGGASGKQSLSLDSKINRE